MLVSSIEALATTRLYEAWFEQKWGSDKYSIRAGQLAADAEFITSKYTDAFINSTSAGRRSSARTCQAAGHRVRSPPWARASQPEHHRAGAIFDGDAAGPGIGDPQERDRYGLNFRINDPPLVLEKCSTPTIRRRMPRGLPGTVKFGGRYHAGVFNGTAFRLIVRRTPTLNTTSGLSGLTEWLGM